MSRNTDTTSASAASADRTPTSATTHMAPPSYTPSDTSSLKSTSSAVKKHLIEVFTQKLNRSSSSTSTTPAPKGKDGMTTEERKVRDEARASYYSTRG